MQFCARLIRAGLVRSAHGAEGGLAVALAESCFNPRDYTARVELGSVGELPPCSSMNAISDRGFRAEWLNRCSESEIEKFAASAARNVEPGHFR